MLAHYDDHDLVEVSRSLVIVFFPSFKRYFSVGIIEVLIYNRILNPV